MEPVLPVLPVLLKGPFQGLLLAWPIWVALAALVVLRVVYSIFRGFRLARSGMLDIDRMSGKVFEEYLGVLFRRLGYGVERTRFVGDFGGDLVLSKDGVKTIVQAKRWKRTVGVSAVQEAVAAKAHYGCSEAMVVSNSYYSKQAQSLARSNKVRLWDRNDLTAKLLAHRVKASVESSQEEPRQPDPAQRKTAGTAAQEAVCAICGGAVSDRVREYCAQNEGRFDGKVLCYAHQRGRRGGAAAH